MSGLFDNPSSAPPPDAVPPSNAVPPSGVAVGPVKPRRSSGNALGWILATAIVLILAVAGGLFTAWVVANSRAVPGPVAAASPTSAVPDASQPASLAPGDSAEQSTAPRRTPTPVPTVETTPEPFTHVVQKGESLGYIAQLYQVNVDDIIALNNIKNPNRIAVGQELLIPGYGVQPTPKPTKPPKK